MLSLSFCAKRGKENPSRRKENPSLREAKSKPGEGKSKPGEEKSKVFPFRESSLFKGLRRALTPFAAAKPGVKGGAVIATPGSSPGGSRGTSGAPHVLLDRHAAKARLKRRASLDALWRLAMTERPLSSEASDRALLGSY